MSEYIERKAAIKRIEEIPAHFDSSDIKYGIELALQEIKDAPTADVVEVVRCKDCKYAEKDKVVLGVPDYTCLKTSITCLSADDFCSYGEREDKE